MTQRDNQKKWGDLWVPRVKSQKLSRKKSSWATSQKLRFLNAQDLRLATQTRKPDNPPNHPDQILSLATLNKNFRAEAATWAKWSGCGKPTTGTAAKPVLKLDVSLIHGTKTATTTWPPTTDWWFEWIGNKKIKTDYLGRPLCCALGLSAPPPGWNKVQQVAEHCSVTFLQHQKVHSWLWIQHLSKRISPNTFSRKWWRLM